VDAYVAFAPVSTPLRIAMSIEPELRRVRSADGAVDLAVWCYRSGGAGVGRDSDDSGLPCLLAHGNGLPSRCYEPLISTLCAAGLHVFAVDQRGCGHSVLHKHGPEDLQWSLFGADLLAVVEALHLNTQTRPLYAFGHSLGGAACLLAEAHRPGTFDALYLFEPVAAPSVQAGQAHPWEEPLKVLAGAALKRRAVYPSRAAARAAFAAKPPLSYFHPTCLDKYVLHGFEDLSNGQVSLRCRPETESAIFWLGMQAGIQPQLGAVTCPVVVAVGARNMDDGPASVAPAVVAGVWRGRMQHFSSQGHLGPLEEPDVVAVAALACFGRQARL
jgi:pimeloyl-ACP methyl ester carboxylesterase